MTERQDRIAWWSGKLQKAGSAAVGVGIAASLMIGLAGCDTVAVISFSERKFNGIYSSGFVPAVTDADDPIEACKAVGTTGDMNVRFVVLDDDERPIRPGENVNDGLVELDRSSVAFNNSALIESSTAAQGCSDTDECSNPERYQCSAAPGLDSGSAQLNTCNYEDAIEIDSGVDFVSNTARHLGRQSANGRHQVFGLLMQDTGSLNGWNPPGTSGPWDSDRDGLADTLSPRGQESEISTDPSANRFSAVRNVELPWEEVARLAEQEGNRRTFFGLWSFDENLSSHSPREGVELLREPTDMRASVSKYRTDSGSQSSRASVYQSMEEVINEKFNSATLADHNVPGADDVEKVLTVFVDGPDHRTSDRFGVDEVIAAAVEQNVRVFIVHLDSRVENPSLLRNDPNYHIDAACESDDDCKNYERCDMPRGYASEVFDEASGNTNEASTGLTEDDKFCVLERDEETGRVGPINDYAQIACASGGGYMYVRSPRAVARNLEWTPYALEGLWETTANSPALRNGHVPDDGELMIHTDMTITVGGETRTYPFSQLGEAGAGTDVVSDDYDTRSPVFSID